MDASSRRISGQPTPRYEAVARALERHARAERHAPLADAQREAFEAWRRASAQGEVRGDRRAWHFDTGCGTGRSAIDLAHRRPDLRVLGVDKSAHRLGRGLESELGGAPGSPLGDGSGVERLDNLHLVRAELGAWWRQSVLAGVRYAQSYLWYPNPWPKTGQLSRRVHGGPEMLDLVACSDAIELRTNWEIYAREFAFALSRLRGRAVEARPLEAPSLDAAAPPERRPASPFERKYAQSGHALWIVSEAGP